MVRKAGKLGGTCLTHLMGTSTQKMKLEYQNILPRVIASAGQVGKEIVTHSRGLKIKIPTSRQTGLNWMGKVNEERKANGW